MELTTKNYNTKNYGRTTYIEIDGFSVASVTQQKLFDDKEVWDAPRMEMYAVRLIDTEHADLMKDALCMAAELFEEWNEDTGKEIVEG